MAFTLRPPNPADGDAIVAVVCACDVADFGEPDYDADALAAEWSEPDVDLALDARVAVDGDGGVVGYALLLGRDVRAWVHPARLGEGTGTALREHAEARARERGIAGVHQQIAGTNAAAHAHLEAAGYAAVAQHRHLSMALSGDDPAPPPAGVSVRPFVPGQDDRLAFELIDGAFADITGAAARSFEAWAAAGLRAPGFDPRLWWIAELDGAPAGALTGEARDGRLGWVSELGVRREARRRGVAAALLRQAFAAFAGRGLAEAGLSVRTANEAGARLYASLGMREDWRIDELAKPLEHLPPSPGAQ